MGDSTFDTVERETQFVLVGVGDFVAFLTRYHFQMAVNYLYAVQNARTWGDFRVICGPALWEYMFVFLESLEYTPDDCELITDLDDDVWVLADQDFPVTNFLEETTTFHGDRFPTDLVARRVETDCGMVIDLYSVDEVDSILGKARSRGIVVEHVGLSLA